MSDNKINVLVVPSDYTGCGAFRSTKPHIALEKMYGDEFKVDIEYHPQIDNDQWLKQYDIIHFHRTLGNYDRMGDYEENNVIKEGTISRLKRLGIVSIMDIDDYWSPGDHHPAYLLIKQAGIDLKILNNIKMSDYVCTTTELFANEIRKYNKNVIVVPNAIDPNEKQYSPIENKSDRLRVGFLGGSSHIADLQVLNGVVGKLKKDGLIDKLQFVLCGFDIRGTKTNIDRETGKQTQHAITPKESIWYEYEKIFTDNYSIVSPRYKEYLMTFSKDEYDDIANEPYRRVWTKPISSYASNYNLFDVSLAPLAEHIFNKVKSPLKIAEAGFHKKVIIAQDFGPYSDDIINGIERGGIINKDGNGLLVPTIKNHKLWYDYIKKLVNEPELVSVLSNNLNKLVIEKYSMNSVTKIRRDLYKYIINK